jgi:hypothetical protein
MNRQTFEGNLRRLWRRVPFHRFEVELVSGTRFTVDHPEALVLRGGTAIYVQPNGLFWWFDHESVAHLKEANHVRTRTRSSK